MLPVRRWPPYACAGLALGLAILGLADQLPAAWRWAPAVWAGSWLAAEVLVHLQVRRMYRRLGLVRCAACGRHTLDAAFEVLGWCLACGHLVTDRPWSARPARR